jgi:hypothetical protein
MNRMRVRAISATCGLLGLVLGGAALAAAQPAGITVLSSHPARVTGGDALVELTDPGAARVTVNGADQTAAFVRDPATGRLRGVVKGLALGANRVSVTGPGGERSLELVNYPLAGPVFSGPHQTPFVCETQAFKLPDGKTLGPAQDADCFAPTNVQYVYKAMGQAALKPFDPSAPRPADLVRTRTTTGQEVDYIVRLETGVINRAIYQIAVLAQPGEQPSPTARPSAWNGALVYGFGGGCGAAFRQGRGTGGALGGEMADDPLSLGYAAASATLNVLGQNCNDVTSAETAMMVKERFVESFGPPRYTIGLGGSGGSMQQNLLTHNYPGILDGLLPQRSFPDTATMLVTGADCPLLNNYFTGAGDQWTEEQKAAVYGFPTTAHCTRAWFNYLPRWVSPLGAGCDATAFITRDEGGAVAGTSGGGFSGALYDPVKSPNGTRCGYFDNAVNVWGKNPDGSSKSYLDNVGVQYGLKPFNEGLISFEQFIDLNRKVGGYNADAAFVPARTVGDPQAIRTAYATGRMNLGQGMDQVPIIDMRTFMDGLIPADVHMGYTTEMARQRWIAAGATQNVAYLRIPPTPTGQEGQNPQSNTRVMMRTSLAAMDRWLDAISKDTRPGSRAEKVARNRPADLTDACFADGRKIAMTHQPGEECARLYPDKTDSRIVAGDSIKREVLKCALQPVDQRLYSRPLTPAQLAQLREAFPDGVCDYSKPSQYFAPFAGPWVSFPEIGRFEVSLR